jgi:outer membrane immunogenic protein
MNKLLISALAVAVLSAAPAIAADMPVKAPPRLVTESTFSWTGFYVGAHVGYGWGEVIENTNVELKPNGILGGFQAGYNYQFTPNWVLGIEADWSFTGMDDVHVFTAGVVTITTDNELKYFGTLRGRLGYSADRLLIYATGGLARGFLSGSTTFLGTTFNDSNWHWGWAAGGGFEYAFSNNLSAKAEYLFIDLNDKTYVNAGNTQTIGFEAHLIRVGLNMKFGGPGPVVARY